MANTGSGSLATILFFFIFPAALRKGKTLAFARLCPRLLHTLFLLSLSTFVAAVVVFGPIDGVQSHHSSFALKKNKRSSFSPALLVVRDDAE